MLAQSPVPETQNKVLDNNPDRIGIWKWFLRRGENRSTRIKKPFGARKRTNNKLNPHMTPGSGIETRTLSTPFSTIWQFDYEHQLCLLWTSRAFLINAEGKITEGKSNFRYCDRITLNTIVLLVHYKFRTVVFLIENLFLELLLKHDL